MDNTKYILLVLSSRYERVVEEYSRKSSLKLKPTVHLVSALYETIKHFCHPYYENDGERSRNWGTLCELRSAGNVFHITTGDDGSVEFYVNRKLVYSISLRDAEFMVRDHFDIFRSLPEVIKHLTFISEFVETIYDPTKERMEKLVA